jgi:hypothetical protein
MSPLADFRQYLARRRLKKAVCRDLAAEVTLNLTDILAIQRLVERARASEEERKKALSVAFEIACGLESDKYNLLARTQPAVIAELDPNGSLAKLYEGIPLLWMRVRDKNIIPAMASLEYARFCCNVFLVGVKVKYRRDANGRESIYMHELGLAKGVIPASKKNKIAAYAPHPPSPDKYVMPVMDGDRI